MPVNLYYTQQVRGFRQQQVKYSSKSVVRLFQYYILQSKFHVPDKRSENFLILCDTLITFRPAKDTPI